MRAVVDLPTATDPAMPITNGVRSGVLAAGTCGRDLVQRAGVAATYRLSSRDSGR